MNFEEILFFFKSYLLYGIIGLVFIAIIFCPIYFFIVRKVLKRNKNFSKKQLFFVGAFIAYIIMVLFVTFLSRSGVYNGSMNLHLFSSYKDAWNDFSLRTWQFIILNIFMFVPFGFLLPLIGKKFQKVINTMLLALLFTVLIELFQLKSGKGILELDDIFNNALGALIGYGLIMALLSIIKSKKGKFLKVLAYISPLIITTAFFVSIFTYYDSKEFGNIPQDYIYKINLKDTNIELNISLKDSKDLIPIYKARTYTEDEAVKWAENYFKNFNIDNEKIDVSPYIDEVLFHGYGEEQYRVFFNYVGGSYNFIDFSRMDDGVEPMNVETDVLIDGLSKFGITIPDKVEIINENVGQYHLKVDKLLEGDLLLDGYIICTYFNDDTIKEINNNLIEYKKIKNVSIKSEKEAFNELSAGKFRYYNDKDIKNITINDVNIDYLLDTKGYYQPVYSFNSIIDGNEYSVIIPAID